ncbi:hypothetical protein F2Q65_19175 [Thiohalocapsa marina]|uniref:Uncharacterized protein n=1 Tax=Thiohalocapsa marina TaxID=424902 RepID=A0A5M8FCV3_9GAMM|nr:hypothetical protein [Thiohalocapsa marina]KAA6181536.1 hypothetical protein F2Q65_19175 [Thiohalocapsa marina]
MLAIKAKVFRSSVLEPSDHAVLDALLADALQARRYCAHDTDAAALYRRAAALYLEIMRRALHNEQRPSGLTGLAANASGL